MWEKANKYKASITDTTFLKIKGNMSDAAIDPFNPNYAFNQVVYLKALEKSKKTLVIPKQPIGFPHKKWKRYIYVRRFV